MMLRGARVEETLIGGPAFGRILAGDEICRVDGRRDPPRTSVCVCGRVGGGAKMRVYLRVCVRA